MDAEQPEFVAHKWLHKNLHNKKQGVKIPLLKVLESLENFFQEVFKQGSGQRPEVFQSPEVLLLQRLLPADNEMRNQESGDNKDQRANRQDLLTANLDAEKTVAVALYVGKNATAEQGRTETA